ncbi:succinate dehydrogenase/fumarate reductase flavoprotein subunit [Lactobacillus colini]|uniref:Urocanate reductase n=1 Tax=Lactobacillus colini TaxID=1819254 RepID=A0ABS4MEU8_9LACO|nr:FAD-binding protein [Lactobacillus colini]MBP2058207.1 succinate dehydrogenase/fumarate reductase flavoprotein subunit [Lactobacillus colini]
MTKKDWNAIYDVVVLGFGGAGATAARHAADAGKKVLMVEVAPIGEEGGNTRVSGQGSNFAKDHDKMMTYFNRLNEPFYEDEDVKETFVNGLVNLPAYYKKYITPNPVEVIEKYRGTKLEYLSKQVIEYPEYTGADTNDALSIHLGSFDSALWNILRKNVTDRDNIDVWMESRAHKLIQNEEGTVIGVEVLRNGKKVYVGANNGIVLTTGGFEANEEMIESYLGEANLQPMGSLYNRGDGISMAEEAGAKMWHMHTYNSYSLMHGMYFFVPGEKRAREVYYDLGKNDAGMIVVADDGTRYFNEVEHARHGFISSHGTFRHAALSQKPHMIMDQKQFEFYINNHTFKLVDLKELAVKADTLAELANKIDVPTENLEKTIADYNKFVDYGEDYAYHRDPETMRKIEKGPFYAVRMVNTMLNTQGGPQRNGKAEIIDNDNQPIPHLYGAGELGSVVANLYQGAQNVAETIIFGQIAGENVAKTDSLNLEGGKLDLQGVNDLANEDNLVNIELKQDEYLGKSKAGIGGQLAVKVAYKDGKIKNVEVVEQHESADIGLKALQTLPEKMVEENTVDVDTVSGASSTTNALKEAVKDAISQAEASKSDVTSGASEH